MKYIVSILLKAGDDEGVNNVATALARVNRSSLDLPFLTSFTLLPSGSAALNC